MMGLRVDGNEGICSGSGPGVLQSSGVSCFFEHVFPGVEPECIPELPG